MQKTTKQSTWDKVMSFKKVDTRHSGVANTLRADELETILATVDFFGGNVHQVYFDLAQARYRVFDWLAMCVQGRLETLPTQVLAHSFIKVNGDIDKFIEDLRITDYQCDTSYESTEVGGL